MLVVVIVLRVHTLIDRALKGAEETLLLRQNVMKLRAEDWLLDLLVAIDQLHLELLKLRLCLKDVGRNPLELLNHPLQSRLGKLLRRNASHLNTAVSKQLDVDLLELGLRGIHCTANHNRRLIEEGLFTHVALTEAITIAVSDDLLFTLHLENPLTRPSKWDENRMDILKELLQRECRAHISCNNLCTNPQRSRLNLFHPSDSCFWLWGEGQTPSILSLKLRLRWQGLRLRRLQSSAEQYP